MRNQHLVAFLNQFVADKRKNEGKHQSNAKGLFLRQFRPLRYSLETRTAFADHFHDAANSLHALALQHGISAAELRLEAEAQAYAGRQSAARARAVRILLPIVIVLMALLARDDARALTSALWASAIISLIVCGDRLSLQGTTHDTDDLKALLRYVARQLRVPSGSSRTRKAKEPKPLPEAKT